MWENHTMYYQVTTKNGYSFQLDRKPYSDFTIEELLYIFRDQLSILYDEFRGNIGQVICMIDDIEVEEAVFDKSEKSIDGYRINNQIIIYTYEDGIERVRSTSLEKELALKVRYAN